VNIHCIQKFFTVHDFWETCACPEKSELPWNFSLYWIYFLHSGFLTTCACPEKQSCPEIFHSIEYTFYIQEFWATCACPEKQSVPWNFTPYGIFFTIQDSWATCACPEKTVALKFFTVLNMFFTFRSFEQFALALKKQRVPWIYCIEYAFFIIQDFWATCACPENFHSIEYVFFPLLVRLAFVGTLAKWPSSSSQ